MSTKKQLQDELAKLAVAARDIVDRHPESIPGFDHCDLLEIAEQILELRRSVLQAKEA